MKKNKREKVLEALTDVQCSRNERECHEEMHRLLWVVGEGTRYQSDIEEAFKALEEIRNIN